jgi:NAD(P)-dependent dehydrogenase (short-subunit alcohol dehydrogenase family)
MSFSDKETLIIGESSAMGLEVARLTHRKGTFTTWTYS